MLLLLGLVATLYILGAFNYWCIVTDLSASLPEDQRITKQGITISSALWPIMSIMDLIILLTRKDND